MPKGPAERAPRDVIGAAVLVGRIAVGDAEDPRPDPTKAHHSAGGAFVTGSCGATIYAECHTDLSQASTVSDKKIRENNDQSSKFPSNIVETGWAGKWEQVARRTASRSRS